MFIPFASHRSESAVPVGRIPGLHSGCALGLVPASGDLLRFPRGLSVFGIDVRRLGVPEGFEERMATAESGSTMPSDTAGQRAILASWL
jgi:hypothetical protein